jgi:D-aminoacyl-tRNA deacylase
MNPRGSPTIVIISSRRDPASKNISTQLVERHGFTSTGVSLLGNPVYQKDSLLLATFDEEIINPPDLDSFFNPLAYVFLSRHSAESRIASLTAHTTGNFSSEAKLGGKPREIGRVNPDLLKNYMIALWKRRDEAKGYQVTIEATHHGPTSLQKPVLFVEIGSSGENWGDRRAAEIVSDSLVDSLHSTATWEKVAIGFGGNHYSEKFNRLLVEGDMSLAAIVPRYSLKNFDAEMLAQLLQKCNRFVKYGALDWKGLGTSKDKITGLLEQFGLEAMRV